MTLATHPGSFQYPAIADSIPLTDHTTMDAALDALQARKDAWVALSPRDRRRLVERMIRDYTAQAERWAEAGMRAKSLAPNGPSAGEEYATGPYTILRALALLKRSFADIERTGKPRIPGSVTERTDGQVVAGVFPANAYDKIFFGGVTAEIWMEPGVTRASLPQTQAVVYQNATPGKVALVLCAGNVSGIGPLDVFYKLFNENQVVILKMNPVNAYLGPLIEEAFRSLIEGGYLRVVYGGAAEGAYLCNHPSVEEIHITGSDKTFDAIVFGAGPDGEARKAAHQPLLQKRITGELGNVSPVIVVPGPWSAADLAYQGEHIASMLTNNAGFNCNATRVIVQHAGWGQREQLLGQIRRVLSATPPRAAYYPGAKERYASFAAAHPEAEQFGAATGDELPWMLIPGVSPSAPDDMVFTTEAFCSLFAESALEASSVAEYIDRAVDFANEQVWGTLNATILVHPASLKDPAVAAAMERAVANLRFGTVGVNYWAGTGFVLGTTTWGAFPGHPIYDIRSGTGVVHNTLMFDRPQKSVLRASFRSMPIPPWFVTHGRAGRAVFRKLAYFEAAPSAAKLPAIITAALRG